ncbi:hypothetical protein ACPPVU_12720 [Mucilaginibacter sp. McL0603]|uniref:hypothetical protein n=1 Tax=Mucilaginibacter sp. McL0603 TaxID=3415670 RepID=UPI003CF45C63
MMKDKKLTYFLIAIVLSVWGMILYRVFNAVDSSSDTTEPIVYKQQKEAFNDFSIREDTAGLLLNYRDPFGIVARKDTLSTVSKTTFKQTARVMPRPTISWSFISYSGYIRNPVSKKFVALLTINGQNVTLTEGETKDKVKLLKNLRDSIKVSYEGKTKFITIKTSSL